ncbi:MAG: HAD-IIA family hydrolase, partial [Deinococcota bacterium]|nr:HAD-IIA family hydrolase [Deinococcota bacterium]
VEQLRLSGRGVFFLTNASTANSVTLAERLTHLGIATDPAAVVAPLTLLGRHPMLAPGCRAFVVGKDAVRRALEEAGAEVLERSDGASVVVLGNDSALTLAELSLAARALDGGAALLALNLDRRVPVGGGRAVPGVGALAALLTTTTGVQPQLVGKPSAFFFREALNVFALTPEQAVMVGDSPEADVRGGKRIGMRTVLVGDAKGDALAAGCQPDVQVPDLTALDRLLL